MSGWIGVDLDGTLAEYHGWKGVSDIGKPIPAMVERVQQWLHEGKDVRIFTARAYRVQNEQDPKKRKQLQAEIIDPIMYWCVEHIGVSLPVTCVKDFGMIELWDDRAVSVRINHGSYRRWNPEKCYWEPNPQVHLAEARS